MVIITGTTEAGNGMDRMGTFFWLCDGISPIPALAARRRSTSAARFSCLPATATSWVGRPHTGRGSLLFCVPPEERCGAA